MQYMKKAGLSILVLLVGLILIKLLDDSKSYILKHSIHDDAIDREYRLTQDDLDRASQVNIWTMELATPEVYEEMQRPRPISNKTTQHGNYPSREQEMEKRRLDRKGERVARCAEKALRNGPSLLSYSDIDYAFFQIDRKCSHLY